jgi:hypothetical protein
MEFNHESSSHEASQGSRWSIVGGEFQPSDDFPDLEEIEIIKGRSAQHADEEVQNRVFYTELLVYALRHVNPALINVSVPEKIVIKSLIDEMADAMYHLGEMHRKQDVKKIAEGAIDEPMNGAKEVPVMQALRRMQEAGAIDYDTRTVLDAVVRAVHIKQSAKQPVE